MHDLTAIEPSLIIRNGGDPMRSATRVIRAGLPDATQGQPLTPSPVFAGTYHLKGDPRGAAYPYGRDNNPTWSAYENAICELENADSTIVFSSGMAAVFATLGVTLKPGDALVMPSDGYFGVRLL